jgi:hypothetical protein
MHRHASQAGIKSAPKTWVLAAELAPWPVPGARPRLCTSKPDDADPQGTNLTVAPDDDVGTEVKSDTPAERGGGGRPCVLRVDVDVERPLVAGETQPLAIIQGSVPTTYDRPVPRGRGLAEGTSRYGEMSSVGAESCPVAQGRQRSRFWCRTEAALTKSRVTWRRTKA